VQSCCFPALFHGSVDRAQLVNPPCPRQCLQVESFARKFNVDVAFVRKSRKLQETSVSRQNRTGIVQSLFCSIPIWGMVRVLLVGANWLTGPRHSGLVSLLLDPYVLVLVQVVGVVGDVAGKHVIIYDDMTRSGGILFATHFPTQPSILSLRLA